MLTVHLCLQATDKFIGSYKSVVPPQAGDIIDANNGNWIVTKVQHDIRGNIGIHIPPPECDGVVAYVVPTN
jgi:hypothetical protein